MSMSTETDESLSGKNDFLESLSSSIFIEIL